MKTNKNITIIWKGLLAVILLTTTLFFLSSCQKDLKPHADFTYEFKVEGERDISVGAKPTFMIKCRSISENCNNYFWCSPIKNNGQAYEGTDRATFFFQPTPDNYTVEITLTVCVRGKTEYDECTKVIVIPEEYRKPEGWYQIY